MGEASKLLLRWLPLRSVENAGEERLDLGSRLVLGGAVGATALSALWICRRVWQNLRRTKDIRIAGLFVYPVKGCRGHALAQAELTPWGIKNDRLYMIVNSEREFVSQRQDPHMALIHPDLPTSAGVTLRTVVPTPKNIGDLPTSTGDKQTMARLVNKKPLFVPLVSPKDLVTVKVWDDFVEAWDQGEEVAVWLADVLGHAGVRLVRFCDTSIRVTDPLYGYGETAFSDGFPVLVTSTASVEELRRRCAKSQGCPDVGLERFRPNIHIEGCHPFEEDEMPAITFASGAVRLPLVKPCSRCTVPGIDPATGMRNAQQGGLVLRTLLGFRSGRWLWWTNRLHSSFFSETSDKDKSFFGQNAHVQFAGSGVRSVMLSVGDEGVVES
ncbi:unnamed protein product [Polarella glacialis]|uniref:MOSC domain-containing protein n=1 Tax=Polarella glacialis TaxID=89957 RepID=A0A813K0Z6_POLGL|nr:unnamed protein product [Polarella glacialis]